MCQNQSIIGEDSKNTIINGLNQTQLLYMSVKNIVVNIINLTFTKGLNQKGGAIYIKNSYLNIINSIFKDNHAYDISSGPGEGGVIYNDGGFIKIYNSTFSNNSIFSNNLAATYFKYGGVIL